MAESETKNLLKSFRNKLAASAPSPYHALVQTRRERREQQRTAKRSIPSLSLPGRPAKSARRTWLIGLGAAFLGGAAISSSITRQQTNGVVSPPAQRVSMGHSGLTLGRLLEMPAADLADVDIAEANLLCAKGLPGSENLDIQGALKLLDHWTDRVDLETRRNWHRFKERPEEYQNSEVFYRMGMLVTVLQQDFGVRYNPDLIEVSDDKVDEKFLSDPSNMFLTGLLREERMGSCSSMPVLYAAIGRRLGYPLSLVTAKDHLFVRWQRSGSNEFVNIEGTNQGITLHDNDHYKTWRGVTEEDIKAGVSLRSHTPVEEFAIFVQTRAGALQYHKRPQEALVAYAEAARLWPENRVLKTYLTDAVVKIAPWEFSPVPDRRAAMNPQEMIERENRRVLEREHPEIDWHLVLQKNHTTPKNP